jgi:hypothetical protein
MIFKNSAQYTAFCIETLTGSVRVLPSLDGDNFTSQQLALAQEPTITTDSPAAQTGTLVGKTTAGVLAWFFGDMRSYKIQQAGATAAQVRFRASGDFE